MHNANRPDFAGNSARFGHTDLPELIERAVPNARPATQRFLAQSARMRRVGPDDLIYSQGEPIPLTLVVQGYHAFRRTTTDGRQLVLSLATRGDFFGLSSIATRSARTDLVAVTDGLVALWSGPDLRSLTAGDAGFALDVIDGMARFIAELTDRLDGFIRQDARRRVVSVLARYEDVFFGQSAVLSRAHLPALVGTSREMTGRVIRELEREGMIIRVGRTGMRLLSPTRLREAAQRTEAA
jgi:CRP-like cAMP-binding protein